MKTNVWMLISSAILIGSCAQQQSAEVVPCDPSPPPGGQCMGDPDHPTVTVTNAGGTITANPHNVCAHPGKDLLVHLVPPPSAGNGATLPKNPLDTWLIGTNNLNPATITIPIPDAADGDYGYIAVNDGKCLDPMVHVD